MLFRSRLFRVTAAAGKTIKDIEVGGEDLVTVEKLQRGGKALDVTQDTVLEAGEAIIVQTPTAGGYGKAE